MDWEALHRRMTSGEPGPWWLAALRGLASGLARLYGLGADAKNQAYDLGLAKPRRLPAPVIGVGNLAVGGTGKTPLVMALVQALQRLGLPAAIVSRGYGGVGAAATEGVTWVSRGEGPLVGADVAGDEPLLLAKRLVVPVAVGPDRYEAGRVVLKEQGPCVLVGDDLFQHRRLHRDLDIVCLDAADPMAGGLLPGGRLREPLTGLRRAQALVLTRAVDPAAAARTRAWLRTFWGPGPVLACRHKIRGLIRHQGGAVGSGELQGRPVLAFCGLARPDSFRAGLEALGFQVLGLEVFPDHYPFTPADLDGLWQRAAELGAAALVCSEKDQVRLPAGLPPEMEIWVTQLELEFDEGPLALEALLAWGLKRWEPRR
jgi:tetraacyldisaccharide 4'-kinase